MDIRTEIVQKIAEAAGSAGKETRDETYYKTAHKAISRGNQSRESPGF